ncbi:MAG: DNA polymerase III subunit delta [Calditrichaeota bacterium]|nr:DNA polymerase III subunit delta [Calditrichota bacterium]RQW03868.1 MAG: DNA polymerase III subunit delta [Calditrichota bacterium]
MIYYQQAIKNIEESSIKPVYLLFGEEQYLADDFLKRLRKKFLDKPEPELNYFIRHADDNNIDEVIALLSGMGLFSRRKLIILKEADSLKQKDLERLTPYLEKPAHDICLVLQTSISSLYQSRLKKLEDLFQTINLLPLRPDDLQKFVVREFAGYGKTIKPDAIDVLTFMVGFQLSDLTSQIYNIAHFYEDRETISAEDIEQIASIYATQDVFELSRLIGMGDREKASFVMHNLLESGISSQQILFQLIRHFSILFRMYGYLRAGISRSDKLARELKVYPKYLDEYRQQLKYWNFFRLKNVFHCLLEADRELKNNALEPKIVLDILTHKILN